MDTRLRPLGLRLLFALPFAAGADTGLVRKKIGRDERARTEYLDKLEAPPGWIRCLSDERLTRPFPGYTFFQVRYAAGSAPRLPAGLEEVNVFVVDPDGKVQA